MKNKLDVRNMNGNWVMGTFGRFRIEAKIFTDPSVYGIGHGRVSKLWVSSKDGLEIAYERGWDTGESKPEVWKPVVAALEKFAQSKKFHAHLDAIPGTDWPVRA